MVSCTTVGLVSSLLRRPARAVPDAGGRGTHASHENAEPTVGLLADPDRHALRRLVERDPLVNAVLAARLDAVASLSPRRLGGSVVAVRDRDDALLAAAFHGGNLLPVAGDEEVWPVLGRRLAADARVCSSIVGPAAAVEALWREVGPAWGPPRAVRERQPLLVLADPPEDVDPDVRLVLPAELDAYVPAAAAMFTEELGISPYRCAQVGDYRRRVAGLIRDGRALALFGADGRVVFKADLGAISRHTCQVQGVWVTPELRGRGIATRALAAVLRHALSFAPTVSLYVNDFNTPARRLYDRLGMQQVDVLRTVLF